MPRRVLQYNIHASAQFRRHEVSWEANSEDASIRQWVSAIRREDAIQIIPKAQYAAWINYVREAEIEVHGTRICMDTLVTHVPRPVVTTAETDVGYTRSCYRHLHECADEIRLILLNPGARDEPISCSLIYTSLHDCSITYEALSYCWGDLRRRQDVSLNLSETDESSEFALSITSDLYSAMKSLRPRTGPARTLWIDAICINQADLDERSSQVARMREIYYKSNRVIVWLGNGNEATKRSIITIRAISERYERLSQPHEIKGSELASLHDPLMTKDLGVDKFVDEWPLFESPWFRRTWVVQEIFNARDVLIYCGEDTLTWPMLLRANQCIRLSDLKMNSSYKALLPPIYQDIFTSRVSVNTTVGSSTELGILEILVKGLDLDATDPRDKIFAMLQFGKETGTLDSLPTDLIPNYRKPAPEVFSDFTRWWIMQHQSLRILSAIQALEGRSWLNNFWDKAWIAAGHPTWSWSYRGHSNWAVGILGLSAESLYRAGADTKPDVELIMTSQRSPFLPLTGIRVDIISMVTAYPYFQPPANHEGLHRAYVGIFDPLNLTGKWLHQLGSKNDQYYITNDNPQLISGHFAAHSDYSSKTGAIECHSNCFFRTREKGLIGLCPFSAQPGDLLVILHGGPVPYVLREQQFSTNSGSQDRSSRYEFVGECYLEGYMYGLGIEEQENKELLREIFVLV
jgi:hypothetical protein